MDAKFSEEYIWKISTSCKLSREEPLHGSTLEYIQYAERIYTQQTLSEGEKDFNDGATTSVRVRTVQWTVINMSSQSRRPTRAPLLAAWYNALRLSWARQHYHWTVDDWKHVTWSDESCFQLYQTNARVRVWRQHQ
ncbi:hypothetical protein AVEN_32576-1 [Araneus ventricosus]|uniref:Transposase Tc1-like domain-containing protein n=1 Tax=Araneus ventricosus TaxID=182803 RepID=A0A4Y2CA56_ARAVE|nr:hypothetical protein AVEN_32576-1 [Araneus ventricosus]